MSKLIDSLERKIRSRPGAATRIDARTEATRSMANLRSEVNAHEINLFLQKELSRHGLDEVTAVEAARSLDRSGMLRDSSSRPGLPLRNLLRDGCIEGAEQRPPRRYGRWFIKQMRS